MRSNNGLRKSSRPLSPLSPRPGETSIRAAGAQLPARKRLPGVPPALVEGLENRAYFTTVPLHFAFIDEGSVTVQVDGQPVNFLTSSERVVEQWDIGSTHTVQVTQSYQFNSPYPPGSPLSTTQNSYSFFSWYGTTIQSIQHGSDDPTVTSSPRISDGESLAGVGDSYTYTLHVNSGPPAAPPAGTPTLGALTTAAISIEPLDGTAPYGGLVMDRAGNLYGTTESDGANGDGTIYEVAKGSDVVTTLASFDINTTGRIVGNSPGGRLTLDSAGNLYGITNGGWPGGNYHGTVFELVKGSGTITVLGAFSPGSGATGSWPNGALAVDGEGNVYGTAQLDGAGGHGTVFEVVKGSGTITPLASFDGTDGAGPTGDVALDAAGNLYGTTGAGGANGAGTVFEVVKGTNSITPLASFDAADSPFAFSYRGGVTIDAAGNLYGTTAGGGASGAGTVFEVAKGSGRITTLASFDGVNGGPEGGLVLDPAGDIFGDTPNGPHYTGTVFEVVKGSGTVTTLATFSDGKGPSTLMFPAPDLALDPAGNLYGAAAFALGDLGGAAVFKLAGVGAPAGSAANHHPLAVDDTATTPQDTPLTLHVLANDTDSGGTILPSTLSIVGAAHGTAAVNANGTVTFTPAAGFTGAASFTYTVADDQGAVSNAAAATISVTPTAPTPAPVAPQVNHFDLVNAKTGAKLGLLQDGAVVSLSKLHIKALDVAAFADPGAASMTFSLNGRYVGLSNATRKTLLDAERGAKDGGLPAGTYTLTVQAFGGKYAKGLRGGFGVIHFRVVK